MDAIDVLCAQLTRDLFAIAKFLYHFATPLRSSIRYASDRFWLAYETYYTRILFFERYVRTVTYSVLAYTRIFSFWDIYFNPQSPGLTLLTRSTKGWVKIDPYFLFLITRPDAYSLTHSLTAALDQLRVVASSTLNDPGPRSRQHQQK